MPGPRQDSNWGPHRPRYGGIRSFHGIVRTLCKPFWAFSSPPAQRPSSNSVLPVAWITAPATDARQCCLYCLGNLTLLLLSSKILTPLIAYIKLRINFTINRKVVWNFFLNGVHPMIDKNPFFKGFIDTFEVNQTLLLHEIPIGHSVWCRLCGSSTLWSVLLARPMWPHTNCVGLIA